MGLWGIWVGGFRVWGEGQAGGGGQRGLAAVAWQAVARGAQLALECCMHLHGMVHGICTECHVMPPPVGTPRPPPPPPQVVEGDNLDDIAAAQGRTLQVRLVVVYVCMVVVVAVAAGVILL